MNLPIIISHRNNLQGSDIKTQNTVFGIKKALKAGSDYIVVGRPVTQATYPKEAALQILSSIAS